jgi:mannose-6-phosphate isomerase-like protein (cupin superfamily)
MITQLDTIEPIPCPCGFARRAFTENEVASLHLVDISVDSQVHYHKKLTEIYLVIEGEGHIELDGEVFPVKPMTAIFIKPGCRHRAVGNLRVVNIPVPAFDAADEWIDEETVAAGDRGPHRGKADQGSVVSEWR